MKSFAAMLLLLGTAAKGGHTQNVSVDSSGKMAGD